MRSNRSYFLPVLSSEKSVDERRCVLPSCSSRTKSFSPGATMKLLVITIVFALSMPSLRAAQTQKAGESSPVPAGNTQTQENIETEKVKIPDSLQTPPIIFANQPGYMTPAQSREMLTKLWQAESRVKDLLTQVHP